MTIEILKSSPKFALSKIFASKQLSQVMTTLLQQALLEIQKLPDYLQDELAQQQKC